ncbi:hypothetical protein [Mycetocola miduiensis]|nr:hypothetical protein [Mycetocola miduiensis]
MMTATAMERADDRWYDEFHLDYDPTFAGESSFTAEDYPSPR